MRVAAFSAGFRDLKVGDLVVHVEHGIGRYAGIVRVGEDGGDYLGARGIRFHVFPGSALRKKQPKWVMAAELTETTRLFARGVAAIEPETIYDLFGKDHSTAAARFYRWGFKGRFDEATAKEPRLLDGRALCPRLREPCTEGANHARGSIDAVDG